MIKPSKPGILVISTKFVDAFASWRHIKRWPSSLVDLPDVLSYLILWIRDNQRDFSFL